MKKILIIVLALAAIGGSVGYYLWNKPPESMAKQKADLGMPAAELVAAFAKDETAANTQYVGKIIAVTGKVKEAYTVEGTTKVTLEAGDVPVFCELDNNTTHPRTTFTPGEEITMKGECAGMDIDGSVQLSHCAEQK